MTTVSYAGKPVADAISEQIRADVEELRAAGIEPTLAILRVGERPDDLSYEKGAMSRAEKVGVAVKRVILPADVSQDELVDAVHALNEDAGVHGVLMFRPLPEHIDEHFVCNELAAEKDVDGFTDASLVGVFTGRKEGFAPCTAQACLEILDYYGVAIAGKRAVVVGRSLVIGKPVALMLLARNATVTIAHSKTADLQAVTQNADILVACVGRAHMITEQHLSFGQDVVDVGINFNEEGKLVGDVDTEAALKMANGVTPVPGGVGSVTTSVLCKHVVEAAKRAGGIDD